jgi:hypothetical protein
MTTTIPRRNRCTPALCFIRQRAYALGCAALVCSSSAGCGDNLALPPANIQPVADARVVGSDSKMPSFEYDGSKLSITLDGRHSEDPDGKIVTYRWLSATVPPAPANPQAGADAASADPVADGGRDESSAPSGRWVPEGEDPAWPADEARPEVMLDEGVYSFTLWVVDDGGKVSDPSTVTITISRPLDPAVQSCVESVVPSVVRSCKVCVCGVSEQCRAAANQSVCDANCWGLLGCVAEMCPEYVPGGDTGCLASRCTMFLTAGAAAAMLGPCITDNCTAECPPS